MRSEDIAVEMVVDDGAPAGRGRVTVLRLAWSRYDPLAVTLLLDSRPDHPALPRGRWVVLRDFLRYGLEDPTGDGDVRIHPEDDGDTVCFDLVRGGTPSSVSVPGAFLREFLNATERLVPAGSEGSDEAIDALIDRLLRT